MNAWRTVLPAVMLLATAGCAVGPDYQRPQAPVPANWTAEEPWHAGQPLDSSSKGEWWHIYGDVRLDQLEASTLAENQTLKIAVSHLDQARAIVTVTDAALFPQVNLDAGAVRSRTSKNRPLFSYGFQNQSTVQTDLVAGLGVHYEADLFGRIRRQVEGAEATQQQVQADLENTRLILTAEVAADYFNLCELDHEIDVIAQSIIAQRAALTFVTSRHDLGAASGLDVAQQQAELDTTTTQIDLLRNQRSQFEHALAALAGVPAPAFSIAAQPFPQILPVVPLGVPSDVLQRRPDIASAERAMANANAQIGVATAAFYPSFILGPSIGYESNMLSSLFSASSLAWSFGVSSAQILFDAGRTRAGVDFAQAGFTAAVANYRQTVLTAMQEVQDGISGYATLGRASQEARAAVQSSQRVLDLANDRYAGGLATYLDVITAQQSVLNNQRQSVQIQGQQMLTSVYLIKALGGGWDDSPALAVSEKKQDGVGARHDESSVSAAK